MPRMKKMNVRLPDALVAQIEAESRTRNVSKSEIVRKRLASVSPATSVSYASIAHLAGSVNGLPADLSANVKRYLRAGHGRKRAR
jgi:hypothetical protein